MFKETFYKLVTDMLRLSVVIVTQTSENYSVISRLKFFPFQCSDFRRNTALKKAWPFCPSNKSNVKVKNTEHSGEMH